jgi:hypothetical protein
LLFGGASSVKGSRHGTEPVDDFKLRRSSSIRRSSSNNGVVHRAREAQRFAVLLKESMWTEKNLPVEKENTTILQAANQERK